MKNSMITTLIAVPLLSLSSAAFAAEPASTEPVLLSAVEMDGVTAGTHTRNHADVTQYNRTRITVTQVSAGNGAFGGNGGNGGNGGTGAGGFGFGGIAIGGAGTTSANGTGGAGTGGAGGAGGAGGSASAGNQSATVISGNFSFIRQQ